MVPVPRDVLWSLWLFVSLHLSTTDLLVPRGWVGHCKDDIEHATLLLCTPRGVETRLRKHTRSIGKRSIDAVREGVEQRVKHPVK